MMLLNKIAKQLICISVVLFYLLTLTYPLCQYYAYIRFAHTFHIKSILADSSKHTITNSTPISEVENTYLYVRKLLNVEYVNNKVFIIQIPSRKDGVIGRMGKDEVYGLYLNNIIIYGGDRVTLEHELAHFFFDKMKEYDRSEMFAQLTEKFFYQETVFKFFIQKYMAVSQKLVVNE